MLPRVGLSVLLLRHHFPSVGPFSRLHFMGVNVDSRSTLFALFTVPHEFMYHKKWHGSGTKNSAACGLDTSPPTHIEDTSFVTMYRGTWMMEADPVFLPCMARAAHLRKDLGRYDERLVRSLQPQVVIVVVFTLTDRASTIPSNIRGCQSGTWSQRDTKVNWSHHGDNPLLRHMSVVQFLEYFFAAIRAYSRELKHTPRLCPYSRAAATVSNNQGHA